jgi:uncharacterized membrane protein
MFIMLLMNSILPALGIPDPLSFLSLFIIFTSSVFILSLAAYFVDRNFKTENISPNDQTNRKKTSVLATLAILFIPISSVLGTFLATFYNTNLLLLLVVISISLIFIIAAFGKLDSRLYPLAILAIAITLLYQISLVSNYPVGVDSNSELYFYNLASKNLIWNPSLPYTYNSALSIVMLPNLYSQFVGISGVWVFKIVYPLIFSLVPLGLYEVYRKQTNTQIAFLATFFFMSVFTFFNEMPSLGREEIAEFFVILFLLVMLESKISPRKKTLLLMLFGASMIISHYGLTYLFMLYLTVTYLVVFVLSSKGFAYFVEKRFSGFRAIFVEKSDLALATTGEKNSVNRFYINRKLTIGTILFFVIFALIWNVYISNSATLSSVLVIGRDIYSGVSSDFFGMANRGQIVANSLGTSSGLILRWDSRIFYYVTELLIIIGVVGYLTKAKRSLFSLEYGAMALISIIVIFATILVPFFAGSLNSSRLYQFTIVFLAPFCVIGAIMISDLLAKVSPILSSRRSRKLFSGTLISIVLVAYFLFNTGFIYEITGSAPSSIALSLNRMSASNNTEVQVWSHSQVNSKQDVAGASWLSQNRNSSFQTFSDLISLSHVLPCYGMILPYSIQVLSNKTQNNPYMSSYIFLGELNIVHGVMVDSSQSSWNTSEINDYLRVQNLIYTSGSTNIYLHQSVVTTFNPNF